jgi:hypothetical protein
MDALMVERFVTNVTDAQKMAAPRAARTVRNPLAKAGSPYGIISTPEYYKWGKQYKNYLAIKAILKKFNAPPLIYVGWEPVGSTGNRHQFVAVNEHKEAPSFIWHKSESYAEGSGQNYVYFGGLYMKVTDFIADFKNLTLEESIKYFHKQHNVEIPRILKIYQDWENKKKKDREAREAFVHPVL